MKLPRTPRTRARVRIPAGSPHLLEDQSRRALRRSLIHAPKELPEQRALLPTRLRTRTWLSLDIECLRPPLTNASRFLPAPLRLDLVFDVPPPGSEGASLHRRLSVPSVRCLTITTPTRKPLPHHPMVRYLHPRRHWALVDRHTTRSRCFPELPLAHLSPQTFASPEDRR